MRKVIALLLACTGAFALQAPAVQAADMPAKARIAHNAPPAWSWSGLYIGAHVGAGWGTSESEIPIGGVVLPLVSATGNGFLGGGQIGYNLQSGVVVFGIEADASLSRIRGSAPCLVILTCRGEGQASGTVTGRVGFTADRALIFVKGGAAWAHTEYSVALLGTQLASTSKTVWGWTVGTGVEYAIVANWSAKIEYNFMDFGRDTYGFTIAGLGTVNTNVTQYLHTVKFGVNYRFGGPVVARF